MSTFSCLLLSLLTLDPKLSISPTPKQFLEGEHALPKRANLFFVYSFFSQYSSIEESQSQSPLFPSSHPPYPGHHNSCLFSLPNLDQAASRSTLPMQALSQGTITSYLNLDKKPLLEVHTPPHTPPFKTVFPAYRLQHLPIHSINK